jgi:glycosyltransferase involved in cell wall biosynthesis
MIDRTRVSCDGLRRELTVEMPMEFSIAVLCYRAEEEIVPFVENLHKIMSLFRFEWELILVANFWEGSNDRTPEICQQLAKRLPYVRVLAEPKQGAMGWDMRRGLEACRGKYIGIIDGDGQFPVEAIFSCFAKIKSDNFDVVKTYRIQRHDRAYRRLISTVYNWLFHLLFRGSAKLRDVNSKPKIMTREAYGKMALRSDDWFIDAELILRCIDLNLRIYEIPVEFHSVGGRKSFVKPGAILEFLKHMIEYRLRSRSSVGKCN